MSLDFCPLRSGALPLLQPLRELGKRGLLGRSGLPLPASLPRLSLPIPRRTLDDVGNRERLRRTAPAFYPRVVPDLRIEKHVRIRELVHGQAALVTVTVVFVLSPLPVRGLRVGSVEGSHRRGRCLPVCDHVEIGRGLRTATGLGMDAFVFGETGRVLRTTTNHVVSVRVPQLVGEVGVTGRGHTIPPVALVTARGHAIDDLPPLTVRGLGRKDDESDEISRRVVVTMTVSQDHAVSEVSACITPVVGGTSLSTLPSAVQDLSRFFLNLAGSSSLGAVGGVAGVTASAAGSGVQLCSSTAAVGAVTLGAATPAGVGVSSSAAVRGVSGLQQRQEDPRSRRRRSRSSSDGTDRRVKKRPRRRSPSLGPSSCRRERHYQASSCSSEEDRADTSPPRAGRAPGGTPGDIRSSQALDRSPHPGTSRSGAREDWYRPGAGHRSPAPSGGADDDRSSAFESVDFDRDDSFRSVLGLIRSFHGMEEPAGVPSARCKISLASIYGLMTEVSPAFSLPASPLVRSLLDDTNLALAKFLEDQTVHGFLPVPSTVPPLPLFLGRIQSHLALPRSLSRKSVRLRDVPSLCPPHRYPRWDHAFRCVWGLFMVGVVAVDLWGFPGAST